MDFSTVYFTAVLSYFPYALVGGLLIAAAVALRNIWMEDVPEPHSQAFLNLIAWAHRDQTPIPEPNRIDVDWGKNGF